MTNMSVKKIGFQNDRVDCVKVEATGKLLGKWNQLGSHTVRKCCFLVWILEVQVTQTIL